jgi:hypothetical protein
MSAIRPQTDLRLIKCPIESDNRNQLTFNSKSDQYQYFSKLPHINVDDFTYQRKDGIIRYPAHIDSILDYNYVMYHNENYSDKWFYAFIIKMEYINDNMTAITIKTDSYQTWQFDISWRRSFIEREHVNDDTVGLHTVPEDIMTGDVVSCKLQPTTSANPTKCYVVASSELLDNTTYTTSNQTVPSGLYLVGFTSQNGVRTYCKAFDKAGKADAINSVFVTFKSFFSNWISNKTYNIDGTTYSISGDISFTVSFNYSETITVTKVNYLDNEYTPVNKKLLTYPYSFLQVSNKNGSIVNYKWEEFNRLLHGNNIEFLLKGTITPGGSFCAYPKDYKNILENYDENIVLGKFPIGGWNSDTYTNWLTQNGINILGTQVDATTYRVAAGGLQSLVGLGQVAAGDYSGGMNIGSGLSNIFYALQDGYRHSLIPDQAQGSTNIGDYSFQFGLTNLSFKRMSIKEEYARICDNYFSMFGYKINRVKTPNITGRQNWNYVKTIGANIQGNVPEEDLNEIKDMFNKGITLWHNASTYLDYSQSNNIV